MSTILIADTNPDSRRSLCSFLSGINSKIYSARSATELNLLLATHKIDLLISDFDMGSLTLLEILKRYPHEGPLPRILMLSHDADKKTALDSIKNKLDYCSFLAKPFDFECLLDSVEEALQSGVINQNELQQNADIQNDVFSLTPRSENRLSNDTSLPHSSRKNELTP